MKKPPLLPYEALSRVLRVARFDGVMVLSIAGAFAVASALAHDQIGTVIGLAVAGAGAVELHGVGLLRNGQKDGMLWLIGSQLLLLAAVLGYAGWMLGRFDPGVLRWMEQAVMNDQTRALLSQRGLGEDEFLKIYYQACYVLLGALTVAYQGGMALYYGRRRAAVAAALTEEAEA